MPRVIQGEAVLGTGRLRLEPLRVAHAKELFPLYQDARIFRFIPHDPPTSLEALEARCRVLEARTSRDGREVWLNWAVRLKQTGRVMGRLEATVLENATAGIAYELSPLFWGAGYATEGCARILDLLFGPYAVDEVNALVDTRNASSIRLLERLGFTRTGRRDRADFFKGGFSDEFSYRLLVTDPRPPLPPSEASGS
jgi:ribosomal-protein-alanine N-acetyltransferase